MRVTTLERIRSCAGPVDSMSRPSTSMYPRLVSARARASGRRAFRARSSAPCFTAGSAGVTRPIEPEARERKLVVLDDPRSLPFARHALEARYGALALRPGGVAELE